MTTQAQPKSPFHPQPAAATVAGIMQPPLTTVGQHDRLAAAAYLMKHAGTTADGKDVNDVWTGAVITARPALTTTTSISDAAQIMTTRHYHHLPVTGGTGLLGVVDIIDVCQALIGAEQG